MKIKIECPICHGTFWVKGTSPEPNACYIHDDADFSECCEHLKTEGINLNPKALDCEYEDDYL